MSDGAKLNQITEIICNMLIAKDIEEGDYKVTGRTYHDIYSALIDKLEDDVIGYNEALLMAAEICSMSYKTLKFIIDFSREEK